MKKRILLAVVALAAGAVGCQSSTDIDAKVFKDTQAGMIDAQDALYATQKKLYACEDELKTKELGGPAARAKFDALEKEAADLRAMRDRLVIELRNKGGDVADMNKMLEAERERIRKLETAQLASEERMRSMKTVSEKLKALIDSGKISVEMVDGRLVLKLASDVLFPSGSTNLKKDGDKAIREVAAVLKEFADRKFQVAGHTDNQGSADKNWQLSATRAISVLKILISAGMKPTQLSAAGYGAFSPVADNGTKDGMAKNRRVEIVLMPSAADLGLDETPAATPAAAPADAKKEEPKKEEPKKEAPKKEAPKKEAPKKDGK